MPKVSIKIISHSGLSPLKSLQKESVDFHYTPNTTYLGAFIDDKLVGVCGFAIIGSVLRYKTDGVLSEYRGKGIYSLLFEERERICKNVYKKKTTAFCTTKSLGKYLASGFVAQRCRNGITFVSRDEQNNGL